jgi:glycosyltransferase involved in cell wall biosynthesis
MVDPRDVEAIADGLQRVLGDSELRVRLAEAGRRRAAGYTWEAGAAAALEALDALR